MAGTSFEQAPANESIEILGGTQRVPSRKVNGAGESKAKRRGFRLKNPSNPATYRKDGKEIGDLLLYKDYKVEQQVDDALSGIHTKFLEEEKQYR